MMDMNKLHAERRMSIYGYALVYQCGIANVFHLTGLCPRLLMQADYRSCEIFCRGLKQVEETVTVFHCDEVGDISQKFWKVGKGNLWSEHKLYQ